MLDASIDRATVKAHRSAPSGLKKRGEEQDAWAIVVGSTHRGAMGRLVPGSVADRLVHTARCPVAIAPRGYADRAGGGFRRVAVAYDGSPEAEAALGEAVGVAERAQAGLRVIAVVHSTPDPDVTPYAHGSYRRRRDAQSAVRRVLASLPRTLKPEGTVISGGPIPGILDDSEAADVDLMVIGSHGFGPLRSALVTSVSAGVRNAIACPVIVVPHRAAERLRVSTDDSPQTPR